MQGEYPYYAARSGLTPPEEFSLGDHQSAYWLSQLTSPPAFQLLDQDSIEYEFLLEQTGLPSTNTVDDLNLAYWRAQSSSLPDGLSVDDYKYAAVNA